MTAPDLVVPPLRANVLTDGEIAAVLAATEAILRSGRFVLGDWTRRFEAAFSALVGDRTAVTVNSGTTALEIIMRALRVAGRDVLLPANTNFATAMAVRAAGGLPVLYDGGLQLDLADLTRRLTDRVAAVVVVHIGGHLSPDLPALRAHLDRSGIPLVEDAAHAHGSTLRGQPAGTLGAAAAFSFFTTKVVTTYEGGAVVTGDEHLAGLARCYRDQGKDPVTQLHVVEGNSWRITEAGAALGLQLLARFGRDHARRNELIRTYRERLSGCPGIAFPAVTEGSSLSGHKAIALLDRAADRDPLKRYAADRGVLLGRGVYEVPLHRQPVFAALRGDRDFARAEQFAAGHVCLPLWADLTGDQLDRVVGVVTGYFA
jgi:perosamine synthetase